MNTPTKRYRPSLTFTIGLLLASLPAAYSAEAEGPPPPDREARRERMEKGGDRLVQALGLTDDQKAKWKAIGEQERTELEALKASGAAAREEHRAKPGDIHQKYKAQRDALLTPEQRAKADKVRERHEKRREERREGGGDKPVQK